MFQTCLECERCRLTSRSVLWSRSPGEIRRRGGFCLFVCLFTLVSSCKSFPAEECPQSTSLTAGGAPDAPSRTFAMLN